MSEARVSVCCIRIDHPVQQANAAQRDGVAHREGSGGGGRRQGAERTEQRATWAVGPRALFPRRRLDPTRLQLAPARADAANSTRTAQRRGGR